MVHLNELQSELGSRGLTVLAVTHEGEKPTDSWVEDKGAEYPYAFDPGGKLARWFGVRGIPHAALIDPRGTIVWRGHPGLLKRELVEEQLEGALMRPLWEWPPAAKSVRKALAKRQFAKALAASEALEVDGSSDIVDFVRGTIRGKLQALEELRQAGDFLGAQEMARALDKQLAGLPEGDRADEILRAIKADRAAQAVIKGQEDLADIQEDARDLRKKKDADKLIAKLHKLAEKHPDTLVATQAAGLVDQLSAARSELR